MHEPVESVHVERFTETMWTWENAQKVCIEVLQFLTAQPVY